MNWNAYYEVVEPIYYLERVGYSPSNSYYGASQLLDTIFVARNAQQGDQFHLLAGGDFLVQQDGLIRDVGFWMPKPHFEKTYGRGNSAQELFKTLVSSGYAIEVEAPKWSLPYAEARQNEEFPSSHPRLTREERSETARILAEESEFIVEVAREFGLDAKLYDFDLERRALLQISKVEPEGRRLVIEIKATESGRLYVNPSETYIDIPSFMEMGRNLADVDETRIYEASFWCHNIEALDDEDFLNQMQACLEGAANGYKATTPAGP
jgi:hypothetical protein